MRVKQAIRNIINDIIYWARSGDDQVPPATIASNSIRNISKSHNKNISDISVMNEGLNFTIFSASGGKIVQLYSYDNKTDRNISNLYIITDKDDLGEELAQIITRESLTR